MSFCDHAVESAVVAVDVTIVGAIDEEGSFVTRYGVLELVKEALCETSWAIVEGKSNDTWLGALCDNLSDWKSTLLDSMSWVGRGESCDSSNRRKSFDSDHFRSLYRQLLRVKSRSEWKLVTISINERTTDESI
jgi:hypothetical protein